MHPHHDGFLVAGTLAALLALSPGETAALNRDAQKCVVEINENMAKVTKAQAKTALDCVKSFGKGKTQRLGPGGTAEACLTSDVKRRVSKASQRTEAKLASKCPREVFDAVHAFGVLTEPNDINIIAIQR